MRGHVNTAQWDAETRKEYTEWLLPFLIACGIFFQENTPTTPRIWVVFGARSSPSHLFKKADAMTSYCIGFVNGGKEANGICYKPST